MPHLNLRQFLIAVAVFTACARPGNPPGGPPDFAPPRLVATFPESVVVLPEFDDWVEFTFDEIISEGSTPSFGLGNSELERLLFISPDSTIPEIKWRRNRIAVRPRGGWRANTVYRVELAAGLRDLRQNVSDTAAVITFTTGAPLPTRMLNGRVVDWSRRNWASRALIEATLLPDSLLYQSEADSVGSFNFGPLPDGEFLLRVLLDRNGNKRADKGEAWDTVSLATGQDSIGEIWAFVQDTTPPRLESGGVTRSDSFGIALEFDQPIDPSFRLEPDAITVKLLPDSVEVITFTALAEFAHDSIYLPIDSIRRADAARLADTTAADTTAGDTTVTPPVDSVIVPTPPRGVREPTSETADTITPDEPLRDLPVLSNTVVVRIGRPLLAGQRYYVELRGVRTMGGTVADTVRGQLNMPLPPAQDSTTVEPDSVESAIDSTASDSVATIPDSAAADTSGVRR